MERLEGITWPRPLADVLESCIATYREHYPWIAEDPSPKSILREMLESGDSFATFVGRYRLERSEGLVLRYLTDAWRTLDRSLPEDVYTSDLEDIVEWLDALIRATDATLLDEWTRLAGGPVHERQAPEALTAMRTGPPAAWRTAVRTAAFGWVELLAARSHAILAVRTGWSESQLTDAMLPYWAEYASIGIDADPRDQRPTSALSRNPAIGRSRSNSSTRPATASGDSWPWSTSLSLKPKALRRSSSTTSARNEQDDLRQASCSSLACPPTGPVR